MPGTATEEAPGENMKQENTVQLTFLPEGKTVQFEHGKLPYEYHGKEESILDVALNYGVTLDHACGGNCACTTCHIWVKKAPKIFRQWKTTKPIAWTWPPICS